MAYLSALVGVFLSCLTEDAICGINSVLLFSHLFSDKHFRLCAAILPETAAVVLVRRGHHLIHFVPIDQPALIR